MKRTLSLLPALTLPLAAQLRITEVMSDSGHDDSSANGDWFEITNTGSTTVNVQNYSFDDDDRTPGASGSFPFYNLEAGASMIVLNESSATSFRTLWNLDPSLRIITTSEISNFPGLGSAGDEANLYNSSGVAVDRFSFGAASEGFSFAKFNNGQAIPGSLSSDGILGAYQSNDLSEDVASPGISSDVPDPLPPFFVAPFETSVLAGFSLFISEYRVTSLDPNPGDSISLSLSGEPSWLTLTDTNGVGRFSGTPSVADIGPHTFDIIAMDGSGLSTSQTFRIDVLPTSSPIILNEYNAVAAEEYLGGGDETDPGAPFDPFFTRVEGNGGAWVEFVVTETTDLRGWTLEIESDQEARTLKLSDHVALSNISAGTILTFSEGKKFLGTSFNRNSSLNTSGHTWTNIWMHDSILIDQDNSNHPSNPAISSDDVRFTWKDASDELIYGPSGESIALSDENSNNVGETPIAVGSDEAFRLEANPTSATTPLALDYDDGSSSSFGSPNLWGDGPITQLFGSFSTTNTPPEISEISNTTAVRGAYSAEASFDSGATLTDLQKPDFIDMATTGTTLTLTNNRPLTIADIGSYEVTIEVDSGTASNNLSYLVFELEVLHPAPMVVLNEYNAVEPDRYLNGGTAAADEDGAPASADSHFGRILGNGGDWFELAVVGDDAPGTIELTDWTIEIGEIASSGTFVSSTTIVLSDAASWSAIPHGTLLTFTEENTAGGGLDTEFNRVDNFATEGYAWTNIHLGTPGAITGTNLDDIRINSRNTAFIIKDAAGTVIFGPAGEGVAPLEGVGNTEIFELEGDATSMVSPIDDASDTILGYDDGSSGSTFGSPNLFTPLGEASDRAQDFTAFIQTMTPFETYLDGLGLTGALPGDDSDQDSFSNLDEYLLGGNAADPNIVPVTLIDPSTGTISVTVRVSDPTYVMVAERSNDLQNWVTTELAVEDVASPLGADFVQRNITYDGNEPKNFFRVASQLAN